jgi:hypothetical protein
MPKSKEHITLQVQCNACNKTVTAYPLVNRGDFWLWHLEGDSR